jgi:hypothetical protein
MSSFAADGFSNTESTILVEILILDKIGANHTRLSSKLVQSMQVT